MRRVYVLFVDGEAMKADGFIAFVPVLEGVGKGLQIMVFRKGSRSARFDSYVNILVQNLIEQEDIIQELTVALFEKPAECRSNDFLECNSLRAAKIHLHGTVADTRVDTVSQ